MTQASASSAILGARNIDAIDRRLTTVHSNPEVKLEDYSELNESLAKLERYERRAFSRRKPALLAMS